MPSTLLDAHRITRRHGARTVLDSVDLRVDAAGRVGLVGPNGSGKSTLLRALAGDEALDGGEVRRFGTVGYLPQVVADAAARLSVRELLGERLGTVAAGRRVDGLAARLAAGAVELLEAHAEALDRWLALGGADAEARIERAISEVGLAPDLLERPVGELSGGQAARAGLAALRAARFDVVLLDEPTNHLDEDGLELLGEFVGRRPGGVVIASHHRGFLAAATAEIVELDLHSGSATSYAGGWEAYERERERARESARAGYERAVAERARVGAAAVEHRRRAAASVARMRRNPSDGDKNAREYVRASADGVRARAARTARRADRIEVPDKPRDDAALRLELSAAERRGQWVVALEGALIARDGWSLGPLDLAVRHGERLWLRGPNGAGKSTLIEAIAGRLELAAGARRVAPSAVVAVLGQDRAALTADVDLASAFRDLVGGGETEARTALASFGLGADAAARPAASLSPGERTRAELAALAQRRATCLLLDEPTNHLDIDALEVLEAGLADWPGALIVATHDRLLAARLGLDRELELASGGDRGRR